MKIEIKSNFSLEVIFSHDCENNSVAITVQAAINAKADLGGANLGGANLYGANLYRANLHGANLYRANLGGANLYRANLGGADLGCANLRSADLYGANLGGANLGGANLYRANLHGANLGGADLGCADLGDADLGGANLGGANLRSANLGEYGKLTGDRPFFQIGPIGSRYDNLLAFQTEKGIVLHAGCFFGTIEEFSEKLESEHGDNVHGKEYKFALMMMDAHYSAWPATSTDN